VTAVLALLTVTLGFSAVIVIVWAFRPLVLFLVLRRAEMAGTAYERSSAAAGLAAGEWLCVGGWAFATAFAAAAAVLAVLWLRTARAGKSETAPPPA
jgi:hypothetical protein